MLPVMNLDEQTTGRVVWLADFNVEISRKGAGIIDFKSVDDFKQGELILGDKLVLASGIEYNPETGEIIICQYNGKTGGGLVTANLDGIFSNAEPFGREDIAMLSVILGDGSRRYVEKHERVIRCSDMFSDNGELLPEFVGKVKAIYEKEFRKEIKSEEDKKNLLLGMEEGRYATVADRQLDHIALDYRQDEVLIGQLKELAYNVNLPKAPDLEKDLGLEPNDSPTLWDSVLPLGVDPLTGLVSFFHVTDTKYEEDILVGITVKLCRINISTTRTEKVSIYEIEDGDKVVLTPEMLKKQIGGKRYRFRELKSNIGYIANERPRELLRGATRVYVEALCSRLGKV